MNITSKLNGGLVADMLQTQVVEYDNIPKSITCSMASGGSCSPSYSYQWQWSENDVDWNDLTGSNSVNLTFPGPKSQSGFYRRKVIDLNGGTIAYSDVAAIYVNPKRENEKSPKQSKI